MKVFFSLCLIFFGYCAAAQELFVFTEPASSRPAKSLAFDVTARYPDNKYNTFFRNRYMAQAIAGINKKWMVSAGTSFSNYYRLDLLQYDGARIYTKYRFLSNDGIHKHFRMAAFFEAGITRHDYVYDEMNLEGDNSGLQAGLIATKLVKRFAASASTSFLRIFVKNQAEHHNILNHSSEMISYSLSAGYLLFPKQYVDYKQMNVNLYVEMLGARCLGNKDYMADIAPAIQFIFNSNTKLNLGARFQLKSNMLRVGQNTWQVGLERSILNAWK